jgi:hypothetical protein
MFLKLVLIIIKMKQNISLVVFSIYSSQNLQEEAEKFGSFAIINCVKISKSDFRLIFKFFLSFHHTSF